MSDPTEPVSVTLRLTISPGSEEYRIPKLVDFISRLPGVNEAEEVTDV